MNKAQHTPGPWHRNVPPAHKYVTVWAGRNTHVAKIVTVGIGVSECEANINLIASAPELLAALQELLACKEIKDRLDADRNDPVTHERANLAADYECRKPWAWKAARTIVAKATGATP